MRDCCAQSLTCIAVHLFRASGHIAAAARTGDIGRIGTPDGDGAVQAHDRRVHPCKENRSHGVHRMVVAMDGSIDAPRAIGLRCVEPVGCAHAGTCEGGGLVDDSWNHRVVPVD